MPQYSYTARAPSGAADRGTIRAETRTGAVEQLVRQGYAPLAVDEVRDGATGDRHRLPRKDLALMTRQLADLLASGMALVEALAALQSSEKRYSRLLQAMDERLRDGRALAAAAADFPRVFPPFYVAAVRAGETGGFLEQVLHRLADALEQEESLRGKVRRALAYPLFMAAVGVLTVAVLLVFVVPTLAGLFADLGQELPWPTRLLIAVGAWSGRWGWLLPLGAVGGVVGLRLLRRLPTVGLVVDRWLLRVPGAGAAWRKIDTARFMAILGALVRADVPVLEALAVARESLVNRALRAEVERVHRAVELGGGVGDSLKEGALFPPLAGAVAAAGEQGNRLGEALERLARAYERETDDAVGLFTSLLEPVLIVVLGGAVAFLAIAMLMPILNADFAGI